MDAFRNELPVHEARLLRYARYLTRNPDEARELVQETYVRALSKEHSFTPGTSMQAWLLRILHNLFCDRAKRHSKEVPLEDVAHELVAEEAQTHAVELQEVLRAVQKLPGWVRAAVFDRACGWEYGEMAACTKSSLQAVRKRVHVGRTLLRDARGTPFAAV